MGREIAGAINDAIVHDKPKDADVLTVYRERVYQCSQRTNIWTAEDLHNIHGEPFDGSGRFWTCGQKLCPFCLQKQSQRNRRILRNRIKEQHFVTTSGKKIFNLPTGQHYKFLTLTMVNPGLSLIETRAIINFAWALFRKRTWFIKTFVGGCKAEEFTLTKRGYHYHLHLLVRCKFIDWDTWRHTWTECVRAAFADADQPFEVHNKDNFLRCVEVPLRGTEDGIKEVAKYITKSDSWGKLRPTDLLDVVRIERWPRMFEFFGTFRKPRSVSEPVAGLGGETSNAPEANTADNKTIVHTTAITDDDSVAGWRKRLKDLGLSKYLRELQKQMERMREIRIVTLREKYGAARLYRKPGQSTIDIEGIRKRLSDIYSSSGRPPPQSMAEERPQLRHIPLSDPYSLLRNSQNMATV